ncbi:tumor necrosis factor ligand superfamily member 6-like [Hemitrygon akajei]|uniref:tumor necrosis factor ligand superfamily member 6-like n=1 Tax=Hemitrygon akajei TaxID=2704970 RepID=UPI003BF96824
MCSREDAMLPAAREAPWGPLHRNITTVSVLSLLLGLFSTAISLGALVVHKTDLGRTDPLQGDKPSVPTEEPLRRVTFFQGLRNLTENHTKLIWIGSKADSSSHNIGEKGNYNVYTQVTFQGTYCNENLLLTITLCKKEQKVRDKELLMTSVSPCETRGNKTWTRTLSLSAIFYFEKGDEIYVKTTSMKYVEFKYIYNNIFGIYRLQH